jgi:hypothetical protein
MAKSLPTQHSAIRIQHFRMHHERHHQPGVHRVQTAQLQHDEEQEEDDGTAGVQQVLPFLPEAYGAQGNEVAISSEL